MIWEERVGLLKAACRENMMYLGKPIAQYMEGAGPTIVTMSICCLLQPQQLCLEVIYFLQHDSNCEIETPNPRTYLLDSQSSFVFVLQ